MFLSQVVWEHQDHIKLKYPPAESCLHTVQWLINWKLCENWFVKKHKWVMNKWENIHCGSLSREALTLQNKDVTTDESLNILWLMSLGKEEMFVYWQWDTRSHCMWCVCVCIYVCFSLLRFAHYHVVVKNLQWFLTLDIEAVRVKTNLIPQLWSKVND